ncbi:hypothetical protein WJX81_001992 [Elliptochloris bilobata]|uniref:Autophagy-related protein 16 domain-containing protein n=1 Tax=Elliptochloris bilobata TaxID=381761 RepID=A0AAW1SID7_9CHLO
MEVEVDPRLVSNILTQLRMRNAAECAFRGITTDYQALLKRSLELAVRNGQLEKEARELRAENSSLLADVESSTQAAATSQQAAAAEARAKELQEELTVTYKDKARVAEELVSAGRQLQIVRESNEAQAREAAELGQKLREARARAKELGEAVERERQATALATSELEARAADKSAAEARADRAEAEGRDLAQRLMEIKAKEVAAMDRVMAECEGMLANARQQERAAAADRAAAAAERAGAARVAASALTAAGTRRSLPTSALKGMAGLLDGTMGRREAPQALAVASVVPSEALRTVAAHDGGCFALAFERSGGRMASGGADKVVRVWDASAGIQQSELHGMPEMVTGLAFTSDARALVAAGSDAALRMWDLTSGRVRHTLTGHVAKVCSVDCSPMQPNQAVSGGTDRCIKVWDLARGFCQRSLVCHSSVNSVRVSLDGSMAVSGHFDGTLRFWDLRSARVANEVAGLHTQQITSVAIGLAAGVVLTCGKDNLLKLVDPRTFQVQRSLRAPGFSVGTVWCTACLGPDERHVAAGSSDGTVFIWEAERSGAVVRTLKDAGAASVLCTAWSPQGTPLVSSDKAGRVTFWQDRAA